MIGRQSQGVLRVLKDHQRDAAPKQLQQVEILELRRVNKELQYQKRDLNVKLCAAESKVAALVSKNELIEAEALALKSGKEELRRQVESLQNNRFSEVEELVYLRWVNACLRCELRNSEANADHKATELNKDLSPRSQGKAKQLMLEYVVLACRRDREERAYDSGDLLVESCSQKPSVTKKVTQTWGGKKCYKLEGGRSGSVGVLSAEEDNLNSIAECFQIMSQSVSTGKLADKYPIFKDRHKLVARVESRPSRSSKTVNGTPPPPPPPPLPAAKSKSPCNEVQRAPQVIELYNTMMKREHSTKPAAVGSCSLADVHSNMVGEIENRSAHLLAIKSDVQKHGRFVESLATDIRAAAFTKMDDVVSFVHWLDEKLSFLVRSALAHLTQLNECIHLQVDERAVIKNFNWPESKVDALRESAFTYQDLSKLGQQLTSFQDDARMKRDDAMKRMQAMLERLVSWFHIDIINCTAFCNSRVEHGIYGFLRSRDTAASCYKEYKIPTGWMIESGLVGKVKHSSVKLAEQFMRRVVSELDTAENELVREFLLLQGVRFAFRVHQFAGGFNEESMQAFEELRNRATSSTSIGHYC